MTIQSLLSIAYFLASVFYSLASIYIIKLNPYSRNNRLLALTTAALTLWAFSFSRSSITSDVNIAIIWNKISAIGWLYFYALMLYFVICLTQNRSRVINTQSVIVFSIPTVLLFVYILESRLGYSIYTIHHTAFGYTFNTTNVLWNLIFNSYYISCIGIAIVLLYRWQLTLTDKLRIRQVRSISIVFACSLAWGALQDAYMYVTNDGIFAPLGIFTIIPAAAMLLYYSMRYQLISKRSDVEYYEISMFISTRQKRFLYSMMGYIYFIGAILSYGIVTYYRPEGVIGILISATYCAMTGLVILYLDASGDTGKNRDLLLTMMVSISIPFIVIPYVGTFSITVWTFTVIILYLGILFNDKRMIASTAVSSFITVIVVALLNPIGQSYVQFDDHVVRLLIIVVATILASYLRESLGMRLTKLRENEDYQKTVLGVSHALLFTNISDNAKRVKNALILLKKYMTVDDALIYLYDSEHHCLSLLQSSLTEGAYAVQTINLRSDLAEVVSRSVYSNVQDFNTLLHEHGVKLCGNREFQLYIPMIEDDNFLGILAFASERAIAFDVKKETTYLSFSNIISNAVTKLSSMEENAYHARYDDLTGLPNRNYFVQQLDETLAQRDELAVAFIDMDAFKMINDTRGHAFGDYLLNIIASRLKAIASDEVFISRFGGDEFVVLFKAPRGKARLTEQIQSIMNRLRKPFVVDDEHLEVTFSCGVAMSPIDGSDQDTLLKNADMAMYEAKNSGKDCFILCNEMLKVRLNDNLALTKALKDGLAAGDVTLHYQPQIDMRTRKIVGVEALLRWHSARYGAVPPAVFIPLAEESKLIDVIGDFVITHVLNKAAAWHSKALDLTVGINVSVKQFKDSQFAARIERGLKERAIDPAKVVLEITEGVFIDDNHVVEDILFQLKQLNVQLSLDDFGTHYSSMTRLKNTPVDRIKIDMSFIRGIGVDAKDEEIIKAIITIAKAIGAKTVAEGVETDAQLTFLEVNQCDIIQGNYFYRPMPELEIDRLLLQ